jgi:hypothetical protein
VLRLFEAGRDGTPSDGDGAGGIIDTVATVAPVLNYIAAVTAAVPGLNVITAGAAVIGDVCVVASTVIAVAQGANDVYHDIKDGKSLLQTGLDVFDTVSSARGLKGAKAIGPGLPKASSGVMSAQGRNARGNFETDLERIKPGQLDADGMLRGTNEPHNVTSRAGFHKKTLRDAWDEAPSGPVPNGKMCTRQGSGCVGQVFGNPYTNEPRNYADGWGWRAWKGVDKSPIPPDRRA